MRSLLTLLLFLTLATPALATDGVLEINQTCAVRTGCFSGDAAGFPVTIDGTAGGSSFRFTSDLRVPDLNTTGIEIGQGAHAVDIDMNGFNLGRDGCEVNSCEAASGNGHGIGGPAIGGIQVTVRNGRIFNMGLFGVQLNDLARVLGVSVTRCGAGGIDAPSPGAIIEGNQVVQNLGPGISVGSESIVSKNIVTNNGGPGIVCGLTCLISENILQHNTGWQIQARAATKISGNSIQLLVSGTGEAIRGTGSNGAVIYRDNVITRQSGGALIFSNTFNAGGNVCNYSLTCP